MKQHCADAFLVDNDCRVLLVRRAYAPNVGLWGLPGGKCEEGERPEESAARELKEETGMVAFAPVYFGTWEDKNHVDVYTFLEWNGIPRLSHESTAIGWFGFDELPPMTPIHKEILGVFAEREWA